jgi:predicted secreted protein
MRLLHVGLSAMLALGLAMPARAATSAAPADTTIAPPEEKKVCRASTETGSLIKKRKACLTKAQWKAVDDQHEEEAHKMIKESTSRPSGN